MNDNKQPNSGDLMLANDTIVRVLMAHNKTRGKNHETSEMGHYLHRRYRHEKSDARHDEINAA
jgi:hypothetical protein